MAFEFQVEGWMEVIMDSHGEPKDVRHDGPPPEDRLDDVQAEYVHVYSTDKDNPEHHYFWVYAPYDFDEWDDWLDYIADTMEAHGMAL